MINLDVLKFILKVSFSEVFEILYFLIEFLLPNFGVN